MVRVLFLFSLISLCLLPINPSSGFETKGQDCTKCHTFSSAEANDLLKSIIPSLKIIDVKPGPMKSSWEVYFESGGKKGLVYVDFSKKYFMSGTLISITEKRNLTQERLTELNRVDVSKIPLDDALVMGDPKARIKIVAFDDPD
jgi:thiol:disulfide interchange protein DsbC